MRHNAIKFISFIAAQFYNKNVKYVVTENVVLQIATFFDD